MVFLFTRDMEDASHGWLFFERPSYLGRRQCQQVPMDKVVVLANEGSWFGAFYYSTNGAGERRLANTVVFFGTGAQVWARMRRRFQGMAKYYNVKPLKVITDEQSIQLVKCQCCQGEGKIEIPALYEYIDPTTEDCYVCSGTCVEEAERV